MEEKMIGGDLPTVINVLVIKLCIWFSPPRSQINLKSYSLVFTNQVIENRIPKIMI